jgi:NAD(P)-dependent dehydrogenase (short-subunit alcohol dehydrogenase family)
MDELYNRQCAQAIARLASAKGVKAVKDLSDSVALITGAAGGIGRAFAAALAAEGAGPLALVDIDADGLEGTAAMLEGAGCEAMVFETDVTDPAAVAQTVQAVIERCGRIDLLANVAGVGIMAPIEELDLEEWASWRP